MVAFRASASPKDARLVVAVAAAELSQAECAVSKAVQLVNDLAF